MELAIQGMALQVLLCLCLVGDIQLSSGEPPTLVNDVQSPVKFTNNFSYRITNTASGEDSTLNNDIRSSDTDTIIFINNINSTNTHTASAGSVTLMNNTGSPDSTTHNEILISNTTDIDSGKTSTFINDIQSQVTDISDSTTLTKILISTTTDIQFEKTVTLIADVPDSTTIITNNFSSKNNDIAPEETGTLVNDSEYPGTETTTVTDNYIPTTTDPAISECEATTTISISEQYEELINFTKLLDKMFETTMTSCHDFIQTKNQTIGESIIILSTDYLEISNKFEQAIELQNNISQCRNSTSSEEYEIGNIYTYAQNVEIVEIVSGELGKMMSNETVYIQLQDDHNEQNVTEEEIVTLLEELLNVVKLTQKVSNMGPLSMKQFKYHQKSLRSRDLDEAIKTTKETIKIHKEIIEIINSSKSMKYLYDDEHSSKTGLTVQYLVNTSYLEAEMKTYEGNLKQAYKEQKIEEASFQLDKVIRPIPLGAIFIVGITGNGILLLVFVNHEDMRTGPNVMIINLNICDILGLTVNILLYIVETLSTDWTLGTDMCRFYRFCRYLTLGLSIYSVVAISVQRFIVLTEFFSLGVRCQFFGKFMPLMNVLLVWVLASVLASPRAIKAYIGKDKCWSASMDDQLAKKLIYMDLALYCVIPFLIILLTSGMTSMRLKSSVRHMPGEAIGQEKAINARGLSANIFLALIIVFAICYMPYFIFSVFSGDDGLNGPYMNLKYASFALNCLIHSNAIFNPIALYITSAQYRKYMKPYLCFTYIRKKAGSETSGSSNTTIETKM